MKLLIWVLLVTRITVQAQEFKSYYASIGGSDVRFRMVAVPSGKFFIGSNSDDKQSDEVPQKSIQLSAFWIGEKEVTFAEWDLFFKDMEIPQAKNIDGVTRPTPQYIDLTWGMGRQSNHPVNSMSQQAAMVYCKWLYSKTGFFYRLPTEAEWEYVCKAGRTEDRTERLSEYAWYKANSAKKFQVVGTKKPNSLGVFDMLGNLSEWTLDQYAADYYLKIASSDPTTTPGSKYPRVVRGGSFLDDQSELRCTNRIPSEAAWNKRDPQIPKSRWWLTDGMFVGFRIVRPLKQPSKEEIEKFYDLYLKN